jgi:2-polyprenyl-3-methyl-5-hydroxy-6-metoxy-1,4-benzoquinol methylase
MNTSLQDDRGYNQIFIPSYATNKRLERRAEYIISQFGKAKPNDILEIGCGMGIMANMIAQKVESNILGIDLCVPFIEYAQKNFHRVNLSFDVMDFNKPGDFNGRRFDYIVGNGILHHLYFLLDNALTAIKNLLKPDGKIIFLEPNIYNPYCWVIFSIPYFRRKAHLEPTEMAFSKSFITKKLSSMGYKNIKVEYRDFLLPGIPRFLVKPSIAVGIIAERIPALKMWSQSIFISAEN